MHSTTVFANATFEEILDDLSSRFIINVPEAELASVERICFQHCPLLHQWAHEHERAYADFMQYRFRIPVCGAIILNTNLDKCVLVKGWSSKSGWGFPKGKINQDEDYDCCAIRERLDSILVPC
ncbi:Putative DCP2 domain-containing protein [Rhizopus microsporus]|nr:Putative DCP2 domain-containing protein [Rhizopus microsporus]